jgi:hypothetical protein
MRRIFVEDVDDFEKMVEERKRRIRAVFKRVYDVEPEEMYFSNGKLRAVKYFHNYRVRLFVTEADKVKFTDWRLDVAYDDATLAYVFEKYEKIGGQPYLFSVEILTS